MLMLRNSCFICTTFVNTALSFSKRHDTRRLIMEESRPLALPFLTGCKPALRLMHETRATSFAQLRNNKPQSACVLSLGWLPRAPRSRTTSDHSRQTNRFMDEPLTCPAITRAVCEGSSAHPTAWRLNCSCCSIESADFNWICSAL